MSHINRGDVHAYLDGALDAYTEVAARRVREHLGSCEECGGLLEREKRMREEASLILALSAVSSVEVDSIEELLDRAVTVVEPRERAEGQVGGRAVGRTGNSRHTPLGGGIYALRWVATVVVSLGAGWIARDLSRSTEGSVGGAAVEGIVTQSARSSVEREDRVLADSSALLEMSNPLTDGPLGGVVLPGSQEVTAESFGLDPDPSDQDDDDLGLDQVQGAPARVRGQGAVSRGVPPTDADRVDAMAGRRAETPSVFDEVRGNATVSSIPFLVPGRPVHGVRLAQGGAEQRGSVIVTQELDDGRLIELHFIRLAEGDLASGAYQERSDLLGPVRPEGWSATSRSVPGGVAVLSGPLTEPELAELLDLALGQR